MIALAIAAAARRCHSGLTISAASVELRMFPALDQHLRHRRQVQPGEIVTGLEGIDTVIGAVRHPRAPGEAAPGGRAQTGVRRRSRGRWVRRRPVAQRESAPRCGPPSAWMSTATSARLVILARVVTHGPTPSLECRVRMTRAPAASRSSVQIPRDVPVEARLGVAAVGLGPGRIAGLGLASVPDRVVDERRVAPVPPVVARVDRHDLAGERPCRGRGLVLREGGRGSCRCERTRRSDRHE